MKSFPLSAQSWCPAKAGSWSQRAFPPHQRPGFVAVQLNAVYLFSLSKALKVGIRSVGQGSEISDPELFIRYLTKCSAKTPSFCKCNKNNYIFYYSL